MLDSTVRSIEAPRPWVSGWGEIVLGLLLVCVVGGGYWAKTRPSARGIDAALMQAGLDALYTRNDPGAAVEQFRQLLALNPAHYGATYQLATALDRAGRGEEARSFWSAMLKRAEQAADEPTLATVRARLQRPDVLTEAGHMQLGLDALYTRNDAPAAIVEFRKVLELNATHYGATFQLAMALDRAGRRDEARPLWETVLGMAEGYNDRPTAEAARARLARTR